jgi:hypothetical protein
MFTKLRATISQDYIGDRKLLKPLPSTVSEFKSSLPSVAREPFRPNGHRFYVHCALPLKFSDLQGYIGYLGYNNNNNNNSLISIADSLISDAITQSNSQHSPLYCPSCDFEPSYKAHSKRPRFSKRLFRNPGTASHTDLGTHLKNWINLLALYIKQWRWEISSNLSN